MSLPSRFKGWLGEVLGSLSQVILLDRKVYRAINNMTIAGSDGTTQIDHVIVSRFGIFVVEAKTMKGWIFGDTHSKLWSQFVYGKKFRFQNPLHQNHRHICVLSEYLNLQPSLFHSVVMFWGDAELKTKLPDNVLTQGYTRYIKSKKTVVFTDEEVSLLFETLRTGMLPRTWSTHRMHMASLKKRHSHDRIRTK